MTENAIQLRVVKADGTDLCELPSYASLQLSPIRSQTGAIQFDYPANGVNADELDGDVEVRVVWGGHERPDCRFVLEDLSGDDAKSDAESGSATTWTGRSFDSVLDRGLVFPTGMATGAYYTSPTDPSQAYTNATAGQIMASLIGLAQIRGCFPTLTFSFNLTHDSFGNAWTQDISTSFSPGTDLLSALGTLVSLGMCEYDILGRELRLYEPTMYGLDLSVDGQPFQIVLARGRDLVDSPVQGTTKGMGSVSLVQGNQHYVDYVDATSVADIGRREVFVNNGKIDQEANLRYIGYLGVEEQNTPKIERSHDLLLSNPLSPLPFINYNVGDWVLSDVAGTMDRHRVIQLTLTVDSDGIKKASVTFDYFIDEFETAIQRTLDAYANGTSLPGSVTTNDDFSTPLPPSALNLTHSYAYTNEQGQNVDALIINWTDPSHNVDGSPIDNLYGVFVRWKYVADVTWKTNTLILPGVQSAAFDDLELGYAVQVELVAQEKNGVFSAPLDGSITLPSDATPPPQASTPTIDVTTFPLNLRISWDGKDHAGAAMPSDFYRCEVHVSTVSGFTCSSSTLKDTFYGAVPAISDVDGVPGTTYYVRLLAFDVSGNPLPAQYATFQSAQASGVPRQAADGELASMSITKLLVGTLTADMTVSGRIKTANSGNRVEMNSAGIFAFNTGGSPTFELYSSDGSCYFVGNISSGSTISGTMITGGTISGTDIYSTNLYSPNIFSSSIITGTIDASSTINGATIIAANFAGTQVIASVGGAIESIYGSSSLTIQGAAIGFYYPPAWPYAGAFQIDSTLLGDVGLVLIPPHGASSPAGNQSWSFNGIVQGTTYVIGGDLFVNSSGQTVTLISPPTTSSSPNVFIGSGGRLQQVTSSKRYKMSIKDLDDDEADKVLSLRPVSYMDRKEHGVDKKKLQRYWGFIAEEVHAAGIKELVVHDAQGRPNGINYDRIVVAHQSIISRQQKEIDELKTLVAGLTNSNRKG